MNPRYAERLFGFNYKGVFHQFRLHWILASQLLWRPSFGLTPVRNHFHTDRQGRLRYVFAPMPKGPFHNSALINGEYAERIDRVIDHLRENLDRAPKLAELAKVACFSEFHFHRIFGAVTGETLNACTNRMRLEKAARLLLLGHLLPCLSVELWGIAE